MRPIVEGCVDMPKIFLIDDHEIVRDGVRRLFSTMRPEWEICGEAANGEEALARLCECESDIILVDVSLPGMNGFEITRRLRDLGHPAPVLLFTMDESESLHLEARKAGAQGCVRKSQAGCDLIAAVDIL